MRRFVGIDSGTQSCKALVVDEQGAVLGRGQAPHRMIEGLPPGHSEQDPREWIRAMVAAVRQALSTSGVSASSIVAMGVSGQQHGFVPIDGHGQPIRPAKLWNDTSTTSQVNEITSAVGGGNAYRRLCGNALLVGYTASKILWLKQNEPENFAGLGTVLLPHDYLNFWLTGTPSMEWGDASGTGLMDIRTRQWVPEILTAIDNRLAACLPSLQHSGESAGRLRPDAAAELGLSPGILVSAGGGDNMMGAIGTGAVQPGRMTVSLGTSGTIYAYSPEPVIDPENDVAGFCDSTGGWLPLVCTMNVASSTEMVRHLFGLSVSALEETASAIPPGSDGLMLLPYLVGERTPNIPTGTGVWLGASARTQTRGHYARAAMEGATLGLNHGLRRLASLGVKATELVITGGGARSATWRSIAANVFGLPIRCTSEPEGAAFGAALQAIWCLHRANGEKTSIGDIVSQCVHLDSSMTAEPDPHTMIRYQELQELHDAGSKSLRSWFPAHRQFLDQGGRNLLRSSIGSH